MKKIFLFILLSVSLVSCNQSDTSSDSSDEQTKDDFVISATNFSDLSFTGSLEKTGKITSNQEVKLSSQAFGRITNISVKEGDNVGQGQILASLSDTIGNYGLSLERAKNLLSKMQINYDSTKITLEKQIFDAKLALEKIQTSLATAKKSTQIDVTLAQTDVYNADYANLDSKSSLDLQKLDNSIAKAELDYNNVLLANKETIAGFSNSLKKEHTNLMTLMYDVNEFADKLFNFSGLYDDSVKKFKDFLGANDIMQKESTKQLLSDMRNTYENLENFDTDVTEDTILDKISQLEDGYQQLSEALQSLQKMLTNSIVSENSLGQSQIDGYVATINGYQASYGANNTGFVVFSNATSSFLRTYKNTQNSLAKQLELARKDRDIFVKTLEIASTKTQSGYDKTVTLAGDTVSSLELQERSAEQTLDNAMKMKEVTLRSLDNSIQEAQIGYNSAAKEYGKLTITAPIGGIVGDIYVDVGQDVANGTLVLSLIGDKKSEIELALKAEELPYVSVGSKVYFQLDGKKMEGTIYSITKVTDNSFNYKVNVIFDTQFDIIGGVVTVSIPVQVEHPLIPISSVKIIGTNKGILSLYKDGKIVQKEVELGSLYQQSVEYLGNIDGTFLDSTDMVIISDVSNFDENKHTIRISN